MSYKKREVYFLSFLTRFVYAILGMSPKGGDAFMETFINIVWVPLLAPLIVAIAVTTYGEWLARKRKK